MLNLGTGSATQLRTSTATITRLKGFPKVPGSSEKITLNFVINGENFAVDADTLRGRIEAELGKRV
jgi:hypothetical protein